MVPNLRPRYGPKFGTISWFHIWNQRVALNSRPRLGPNWQSQIVGRTVVANLGPHLGSKSGTKIWSQIWDHFLVPNLGPYLGPKFGTISWFQIWNQDVVLDLRDWGCRFTSGSQRERAREWRHDEQRLYALSYVGRRAQNLRGAQPTLLRCPAWPTYCLPRVRRRPSMTLRLHLRQPGARVRRNAAARSQRVPGAKDAAQDGPPGPVGKRQSIAPARLVEWGAGLPVWRGRKPRYAAGSAGNLHKHRVSGGSGSSGAGRGAKILLSITLDSPVPYPGPRDGAHLRAGASRNSRWAPQKNKEGNRAS